MYVYIFAYMNMDNIYNMYNMYTTEIKNNGVILSNNESF